MNMISDKRSEFVRILAGRRNANCSGPVKVQMSQLVADHLNFVSVEVQRRIENDVVVNRSDRSLSHFLGDKEEIVHVSPRNFGVDYRSRIRIVLFVVFIRSEETLVDLFLFKFQRIFLF